MELSPFQPTLAATGQFGKPTARTKIEQCSNCENRYPAPTELLYAGKQNSKLSSRPAFLAESCSWTTCALELPLFLLTSAPVVQEFCRLRSQHQFSTFNLQPALSLSLYLFQFVSIPPDPPRPLPPVSAEIALLKYIRDLQEKQIFP